MNQKQQEEMEQAARFLRALGHVGARLEAGDLPDVIAFIEGRRIGIEVTQFHADEQPDVPGSSLRAAEKKKAKDAGGRPYFQWGVANPLPGLVARIKDKIAIVAAYDETRYAELWLLISSQLPKMGALAATYAVPGFIDIPQLNQDTHAALSRSSFAAVHLHLMLSHAVYSWTRAEQWHVKQVQES